MAATAWENRNLGFKSDVEHFAADDIGRSAERGAALSYYSLTEHGLSACITAHTHECSVKFFGKIFARRFTYYKTGLCLEGNDIMVNIVPTGQAVKILRREGYLFACRNFNILILVLPVGSGCHTPVTLIVLHEHAHRDCLAALVLKRHIEKFARILKIGVHCRWQFGELGFNGNVDGKVNGGIVHNNVIIVPLAAVVHEQHNHFTLSAVAYLGVVRIGSVIYKRACRYLCNVLHVLVALEFGHHIVWDNALRCHKAILAVGNVSVMQYSVRGVLLLAQLVYAEVIDELACNRETGIVERWFGPRETGIERGEIGCMETALLNKA